MATLWGETVLILDIRGERVTFASEGGKLDYVDLDVQGCDLTIARPTADFPIGYKFAADIMPKVEA